MNYVYHGGYIKRRSDELNQLSKTELMIGIQDDNALGRIVTLREWAFDQARNEAAATAASVDDLTPLTEHLANTKYNMQRPFIDVGVKIIVIGVDADIIDDNAIAIASIMLTEVEDFSVIAQYYFGPEVDTSLPVDTIKKLK